MAVFYKDVSNTGVGFVENLDSVEQGLINLLSTKKKERVNRPWLGCDLDDGLFEIVDEETATMLQQSLYECLVQEPRIDVHNILVEPDYEKGGFRVTIVYSIVGLGDQKFELAGTLLRE